MTKKLLLTLKTARPPFLTLPFVCVFLGASVSRWRMGHINLLYGLLALLGAVLSHVAVNAINEYLDYKSGLDTKTVKTPFSGGSGVLPENPDIAPWTLFIAILSLIATLAIGIYFYRVRGLAIVPIGIAGLVIVILYTTWITKHPLLCLVAPGFGFGILWVMGTDFVLSGSYSLPALSASLVPFFLVNCLLLLNQFPDAEADLLVGRKHLPIVIGKKKSAVVLATLYGLCHLAIATSVLLGTLPKGALAGLSTIPLAVYVSIRAIKSHEDLNKLIPALKVNVLINLLTPLLVGAGTILSKAFFT